MTNWIASISEDIAVVVGLWTAVHYPVLFLLALLVMIAVMIWLLPKLWRGIKLLFARIVSLFESGAATPQREVDLSLLSPRDNDKR